MARVQNTLIGKSSGSVGGATFSTWKGINVLKSKAETVANPNTVPQQTQRNRMALMVLIYRLIAGAIAVGFKTQAIGQSEYNAFISNNITNATLSAVPPTVTFVPGNALMAKGTMGNTPVDGVAGTNASANVVITWDNTLEPVGSNAGDLAYAIVWNATQATWAYAFGQLRSTGTQTVVMDSAVATSDVLHAWLFFKAFDSDVVSDSTYDTVTV